VWRGVAWGVGLGARWRSRFRPSTAAGHPPRRCLGRCPSARPAAARAAAHPSRAAAHPASNLDQPAPVLAGPAHPASKRAASVQLVSKTCREGCSHVEIAQLVSSAQVLVSSAPGAAGLGPLPPARRAAAHGASNLDQAAPVLAGPAHPASKRAVLVQRVSETCTEGCSHVEIAQLVSRAQGLVAIAACRR